MKRSARARGAVAREPRQGAARSAFAIGALLTLILLPRRSGGASSSLAERDPALVVISAEGLAPSELRVAAGVPILWLNRASQSAIAISFEHAFPSTLDGCGVRRAFHAVPGYGPFTMLLPPGSVAALCAPSEAGRYDYTVHGEVAFSGLVDVVEGDTAMERSEP